MARIRPRRRRALSVWSRAAGSDSAPWRSHSPTTSQLTGCNPPSTTSPGRLATLISGALHPWRPRRLRQPRAGSEAFPTPTGMHGLGADVLCGVADLTASEAPNGVTRQFGVAFDDAPKT